MQLRTACFVFCLVIAVQFLSAASASCEEFHILLLRQTPQQQMSEHPEGVLLIDGGYADGIEEGLTGHVWGKDSEGERIDVAEVTVIDVNPYEAACRFVNNAQHYTIGKNDEVDLEPDSLDVDALLAKATEIHDAGNCERALYYYTALQKLEPGNWAVAKAILDCRTAVQEKEDQGPTAEEIAAEKTKTPDYLEIANSYIDYGEPIRACEYLDKIISADSTNERALTLKQGLEIDSADIPSNYFGPGVESDLDEPAEMIHYIEPAYPDSALRAGIGGVVWIAAYVDANGKVMDAKIYKSSGSDILDDAALKVAKLNRFKPAAKGQFNMATWVVYKIEFNP